MKYRYFMFGMFTGTDGNRYDICLPTVFVPLIQQNLC